METMIRAIIMDIDGVLTDGKKYINSSSECKSICLKDLDAITSMKQDGYLLAAITGEKNEFTDLMKANLGLDFFYEGCKDKLSALNEFLAEMNVDMAEACYIGDGKYDIPVLSEVGFSVCPNDAIGEVKEKSTCILSCSGGEGCIAELYSLIKEMNCLDESEKGIYNEMIAMRLKEHQNLINDIVNNDEYRQEIIEIARCIIWGYRKNKKVLLCGNGGSAADAQHLAAELVSRFYMERRALFAEALTVNSSVVTAIANDYSYDRIFARQVEAKGAEGDVLIGITTSGKSRNIIEAFETAKHLGMHTVLLTGDIAADEAILQYTDHCLSVPAANTPRIQEVHILIGHIICEIVEKEMAKA